MLEDLRTGSGRPHWVILDEAHHIFPSEWPRESAVLPEPPKRSLMITVHPQHVSREALESIDIVVAVGKDPDKTICEFCSSLGVKEPRLEPVTLGRWEVLVWFRREPDDPVVVTVEPGKAEHKRHIRKYAEGDLRDRSFVFRGSDGRLNLATQNFITFIRIASGVDDDTWVHHLRRNDYSRWIREVAKDDSLAEQIEQIEKVTLQPRRRRSVSLPRYGRSTPLPSNFLRTDLPPPGDPERLLPLERPSCGSGFRIESLPVNCTRSRARSKRTPRRLLRVRRHSGDV
jgi:hypothetical protein